jgi:hypothetical protein
MCWKQAPTVAVLADRFRRALADLGYTNAQVKSGNGSAG